MFSGCIGPVLPSSLGLADLADGERELLLAELRQREVRRGHAARPRRAAMLDERAERVEEPRSEPLDGGPPVESAAIQELHPQAPVQDPADDLDDVAAGLARRTQGPYRLGGGPEPARGEGPVELA